MVVKATGSKTRLAFESLDSYCGCVVIDDVRVVKMSSCKACGNTKCKAVRTRARAHTCSGNRAALLLVLAGVGQAC